ncbi:hypothetical protein MJO29_002284, partial [Puccinia striiformis f. sp. tritici]
CHQPSREACQIQQLSVGKRVSASFQATVAQSSSECRAEFMSMNQKWQSTAPAPNLCAVKSPAAGPVSSNHSKAWLLSTHSVQAQAPYIPIEQPPPPPPIPHVHFSNCDPQDTTPPTFNNFTTGYRMTPFTSSLIALAVLNSAQAALSPIFPVDGSTCAVLHPCQVKWQDDASLPSTTTMGETTIDLVMGSASNLKAVQNLGGVQNPSLATAITFEPLATLSQTEKFAIRFIAKNNASHPIFSTYFSITAGTAVALVTPNSALAASNPPASGSPSPVVGSKAPGASNSTSSTAPTMSMNASKNDTAATSAPASAASSFGSSLTAISGMAVLFASTWFL